MSEWGDERIYRQVIYQETEIYFRYNNLVEKFLKSSIGRVNHISLQMIPYANSDAWSNRYLCRLGVKLQLECIS